MAANYPLHIEQGATFQRQWVVKNRLTDELVPLTGFTATSQIRDSANVALVLTITPVIDTVNSTITITLTGAQTATLTGTEYLWGLKLTASGGEPNYRYVEGKVTVSPAVVR
jgi:hypothetical protein